MVLARATNPLLRESRRLVLCCRRLNEDVERIQEEASRFYGSMSEQRSSASRIISRGYFKNDSSQSGAVLGLLIGYFENDVYTFYVTLRSHLDSLAHLIRLNHESWGQVETSMHDLLKSGSKLSNHDSEFHKKLVAELPWFENTKKFRDDLAHGKTYFVPRYDPGSRQIVLEVYENADRARLNLLWEYTLDLIQTDVDHLVSLYGFLEDNLKFDWMSDDR